jgi:MFS family permease
MPVVAKETLHGDAHTYGFLMAAAGAGALLGALHLASRENVLGLGRVIVIAASVFGLSLAAFSLSHTMWLPVPLPVVAGMAMMTQPASSNTILQTIVEEDKRGRVMSLYTTAVFGAMPFGSMIAGVLADRIGTQRTILLGGAGCAIGALLFLRELPELRKLVRPIYRRLGILPEVAKGIETASKVNQLE